MLFTPTTPTPAFPLGAKSDPYEMYLSDIFTVTANLAGVPAMSLPIGRVDGLPVGGQFIATHFDERADVRRGVRARARARRGGAPMTRAPRRGTSGTRWSSGSRSTSSSRRARRSSAAARRTSARRRTRTPVRCVSRCPARCRCSTSTPSSSRCAPRSRSAARCSRRRSSRARTTSIPICRRAIRSRSSTSRSRSSGCVEIGTSRRRLADHASASRACTWRRTRASRSTIAFPASRRSTSIAPACRSSRS